MKSAIACTLATVISACGANQGTRPHDMSEAQHQAAAGQEDQAAEAHAAQHDPAATTENTSCGRGGCWTSSKNPTRQHAEEAKEHREVAAKHRSASTALAAAEGQACSGLSDEDRDMSPFMHREDIQSVGICRVPPVSAGEQ